MSTERFLLTQLDQLVELDKKGKNRCKETKEIYNNFLKVSSKENQDFRKSEINPQFTSFFSDLRRKDDTVSLFYSNDQESKVLILNYLPIDQDKHNKKEISSIFLLNDHMRYWCSRQKDQQKLKDHSFSGESFIFRNENYCHGLFIFKKTNKQDFRRANYIVNQQDITFQIQLNSDNSPDIININNNPKKPKEVLLTPEKRKVLLQISQEVVKPPKDNPWSPIYIR